MILWCLIFNSIDVCCILNNNHPYISWLGIDYGLKCGAIFHRPVS